MRKYMKFWCIFLCVTMIMGALASCDPIEGENETSAQTTTQSPEGTQAETTKDSQLTTETAEEASTLADTTANSSEESESLAEATTEAEIVADTDTEEAPQDGLTESTESMTEISTIDSELTELPAVGTEALTEVATDTPTETPTTAPAETPTEASTTAPAETPTEASTTAPAETPTEVPTTAPTETPTEAPTTAPAETSTEASTTAPAELTTNAPVEEDTQGPSAYRVVDNAYTTMYSTADTGTLPLYTPYRNQAEYEHWDHKVSFSMNSGINYIYEEGFIALDRTVESVVFGYSFNGNISWSEDGENTFSRAALTEAEATLFDHMDASVAYAYTGLIAVNFGILLSVLHRGDNHVTFLAMINGKDIVTINEYTLTITETLIATPTTKFRYHGCVDSINGTPTPDFFGYKDNNTKKVHVGVMDSFTLNSTTISLKGWGMINGGQQDYFWSVDGNIWHSFDAAELTDAGPDVINAVTTGAAQLGSTFAANGRFDNMKADLSAYAGMNVTFRLAVRSASDVSNGINNTLCHIITINNLKVGGDRGDLTVISYNVKTENGAAQSGVSSSWDTRVAMLKEFVTKYMPDSIGMQEVTPTWRSYMDSQIFDSSIYAGVGVARTTDESKALEQCTIYYRKDKYTLVDSGTFWLSDTPDVVGSKYEECEYPRICTYVVLKNKTTGEKYIHMNTHLAHEGGDIGRQLRAKQIGVMFNKLYELGTDIPVVITGDFNQRKTTSKGKNDAVYKLMVGLKSFTLPDGTPYTFKNLADSRLNAHDSMSASTTATMVKYYNTSYNPIYEPIDYCFYSSDKLEALSYFTLLSPNSNGEYMSDHLPVITRFNFK